MSEGKTRVEMRGPLQRKGTYDDKCQIYVPPGKKKMLQEVREMLDREGKSLSKFVIEKAEEYHRLHDPGNPQQLLDVIMKLGKAYHAPGPLCEVRDCFRKVWKPLLRQIPHTKKQVVGMCELHGRQYLRELPLVYSLLVENSLERGK